MAALNLDEQAIFEVARKIDSREAREAYLQETCGDDAAIGQRVRALLKAYEDSASFLEAPVGKFVGTVDEPIRERPGTVIGPYKLLQQIGEGGMGVVWMAEQTQPVHRKVALKVIKPGMDSRQVTVRFEAERQALAMMDHVNIARVFDGGATEAGRPYFVMELVHGVPITKYCDDNHLTPRERLELFVPVCQAIQHAHQKGIIHRDIKPSNVMITLYDGKPVPKVIDFGVAKATEQRLTERTLFTQYGTMVGTFEYMSPEQAEMSGLGVDTRSDIYSLGVLLYELLTGSTPLSHKRLKEAAYAEILRLIKEEEPPRPSTRLSESGEALASISAQRHMEPAKLTKLVKGELDWIVMKTLEKDRNRRYETANGFAADVQRYLNDEPVHACPPSAGYRLRKFVRRNKAALATLTVVAFAVLLGVVALAVSYVRVQHESERKEEALKEARANFRKARAAVNRSFTRISESDLFDVTGLHPLRLQLLQDAIKYYRELADQQPEDPTLQAELAAAYFRAWQVYSSVDQGADSDDALRRALDIVDGLRREHAGNAEVLGILAAVRYGAESLHASMYGDPPALLRTLGRSADTWAALAAENPAIPEFQRNLAEAYHEIAGWHGCILDTSAALRAAQQALPIWEKLSREHPHLVNAGWEIPIRRAGLGIHLANEGHLQEALKIMREGIAFADQQTAREPKERRYRIASADLNRRMGGILLLVANLPKDAEQPYRRAAALYEGLADDYPGVPSYPQRVSDCYYGLAELLRITGRAPEAEQLYGTALQRLEKLRAAFPRSADPLVCTFRSKFRLAQLLVATGRTAEGEKVFREAVAFADRLVTQFPTEGHLAGDVYGVFGHFLETAGRLQEAEEVYRKTLTTFDKLAADMPEDPSPRFESVSAAILLGALLQTTGRPAAAEEAYRRGLDLCDKLTQECPFQPTYRKYLLNVRRRLAVLLSEQGRIAEAEQIARLAVADCEKLLSKWYPGNSEYRRMLGDVYGTLSNHLLAAGRPKEAEQICTQAIEKWPDIGSLLVVRGRIYLALQQPHQALADFSRAIELAPNDGATPWWYLDRATAYAALKQEDMALAELSKAVERWPNLWDAWVWRGRAYATRQLWDKALTDLSKAIELKPGAWEAWSGRAFVHFHRQQWDRAVADFSKAIDLVPQVHTNWWHRGHAYLQLAQWDKAAADFGKVVDQWPDQAEAWYLRGVAFAQLNQSDKALADLGQAIAKGFNNVEQLKNDPKLAPLRTSEDFGKLLEELERKEKSQNALLQQKKLDDAIACHRKAIDLDPKSAKAHTDLGIALRAQGKLDEAIACHRKAIDLDPKSAKAHNNLGYTLDAQGKVDEAVTSYRKSIELDPKSAWAHNALGRALMKKGWDLANCPDPKLRDPKRAVQASKEAVELAPQSALAWQYLGWVQYRTGNWKASLEALEESCKLEKGGDCGQWIALALTHGKLASEKVLSEQEQARHKTEARRRYDQAVKQIDGHPGLKDQVGQAIRAFRAEAAELFDGKEKPK